MNLPQRLSALKKFKIKSDPQPGPLLPANGAPTLATKRPLEKAASIPEAEATSDPRPLRRRVIDLAWPIIGENFMETLLGIVDTLMVARLGSEAIAGVGSAIQVLFFVMSALSALAVGSAVLVAQAYGGKNYERAGQLARQSMIWSVLLSVPLALAGLSLAGPIIGLFGLEPAVTQIGIEYLQVTMGTSVVMTALFIGGGVLRGADDSRTPMQVKIVANVVNIGLTYGLIFGYFGLPALGAVGSAWGTFIARSLGLMLLMLVLWRGRNGVSIRGAGSWLPNFDIAGQVLRIGVPAALEQVLISTAFFMLTIVVAALGTLTFAAHRIVMISMSLSFMPGMGFSMAATSLVGQSIGARKPAEAAEAAWIATLWGVIWMSAIGVVFLLFAPYIMLPFADDTAIVTIGAKGLRVIALSQPFWAIFFVQAGALRGTGNTQFPLRVNATGIWVAVGLAYSFMQLFNGGLGAIWSGFLIVAPVTSSLISGRFRRTITDIAPDEVY